MKYSSRLPVLTIGLAVGLSSFVIVILLIIAIVCCCKISRNRLSKSASNRPTLSRNTDMTTEAYEPPSDQMYSNQIYVRPSVQSYNYESSPTELYANALELKRHWPTLINQRLLFSDNFFGLHLHLNAWSFTIGTSDELAHEPPSDQLHDELQRSTSNIGYLKIHDPKVVLLLDWLY